MHTLEIVFVVVIAAQVAVSALVALVATGRASMHGAGRGGDHARRGDRDDLLRAMSARYAEVERQARGAVVPVERRVRRERRISAVDRRRANRSLVHARVYRDLPPDGVERRIGERRRTPDRRSAPRDLAV